MKIIKQKFKKRKKIRKLHIPKYLKFKRYFQILVKGDMQNINLTKFSYGFVGLITLQNGYLTLAQIEILKNFLRPPTKNKFPVSTTNLWIKLFTDRILTEKPSQSRIGRGKGLSTIWYTKIYKNQFLIEIRNTINIYKSIQLLKLVIKKLPILTKIIYKEEKNIFIQL